MKNIKIFAVVMLGVALISSAALGQLVWHKAPGAPTGTGQYVDRYKIGGSLIYVDSTNTSAGDTTGCGTWIKPCDTIQHGINRATDAAGDVLVVLPGHNENEDVVINKDGVSIIGLGEGDLRPTIDYDATTTEWTINGDGDNVLIQNIRFNPSVNNVVTAIILDPSTAESVDNVTIEDCYFDWGETSGTDEFINIITANTVDNLVIRNNTFYGGAITSVQAVSAVYLVKTATGAHIIDNLFYGNYSTAAIKDTVASILNISGNRMKVKDGEPGIEAHSSTTGIISGNRIESTGVTCNSAIVAADASWFDNWCVRADGEAAQSIGTTSVDTDLATIISGVAANQLDANTIISVVNANQLDANTIIDVVNANQLDANTIITAVATNLAGINANQLDADTIIAVVNANQLDANTILSVVNANQLDANTIINIVNANQLDADTIIDIVNANQLDANTIIANQALILADGDTLIGDRAAIGTELYVQKTIAHASIVAAGIDLTAASSGGDLELVELIVLNGSTAGDSVGHGAVVEFYTTNVKGSASFITTADDTLVANGVQSIGNFGTTNKRVVLESGKKIKVKATTEDVTSAGTCEITMRFKRLARGATVTAAP